MRNQTRGESWGSCVSNPQSRSKLAGSADQKHGSGVRSIKSQEQGEEEDKRQPGKDLAFCSCPLEVSKGVLKDTSLGMTG